MTEEDKAKALADLEKVAQGVRDGDVTSFVLVAGEARAGGPAARILRAGVLPPIVVLMLTCEADAERRRFR